MADRVSQKLKAAFASDPALAKRKAGVPKKVFVPTPVGGSGSGPKFSAPPATLVGPSVLPPFDPSQGDPLSFGTIGSVDLSGGGLSVSGDIFGIPVSANLPFGGGSSEPASGGSAVPGSFAPSSGGCPGIFQVRGPNGTCVDLTALPPGGDPALTGRTPRSGSLDGFGDAVLGLYGVGIVPRADVQTVRRCPRGMALGKDGICYEGLHRNSPRREWPMGMKPLMTGGDRSAIRRAAAVAGKLGRAKKSLNKASKALAKVC